MFAVKPLRFEGVCKAVFRMIKTLLSWQLRLKLEMSTVSFISSLRLEYAYLPALGPPTFESLL